MGETRSYYLGAIAIRDDGKIVHAYNGFPTEPTPKHHCEARLIRKLNRGSTVYVARILNISKEWANSEPCADCQRAMKRAYVKRVFFTIGPDKFGCIDF